MKKILIVVGTRPNFIKVTRFKELANEMGGFDLKIIHTGQHHAANMSDVFFEQFNLKPDFNLEIDSGSSLIQMGEILIKLEKFIKEQFKPDLIITPGDVNSTLAVAIVANKLGNKLAHLESGLRSDDREMPEEINRIVTDELADYYFVTENSGVVNLTRENKKGKIFLVGNTMIDTLVKFENQIDKSNIKTTLGIRGKYIVMTMHRPANVDTESNLVKLMKLIENLTKSFQLVFPIHPRTIKNLHRFGFQKFLESNKNLITPEPLGYFEFQNLIKHAELIITDSGGIQEETTYRKIPCLTLRPSTERPVTSEIGTNTLVEFDEHKLMSLISSIENGSYKRGEIPPLWDGKATERILEIIKNQQ